MNTKSKISALVSSKAFMVAISYLGLYLLSTGVSVVVFSFVLGKGSLEIFPGDLWGSRARIDPGLPRTEVCPINGEMFTTIERSIWESRRPIAAVIENHVDSRPPSGLSKADVVYEAVAEGGITRFLGIFYCGAAAEEVKIAPVRSVRVYFIDFASEYGDRPIFMHVGGANDYRKSGDTIKEAAALELLETIGWRVPKGNALDTTYDSGFPVFWRNYERLGKKVATEHTMMASLDAAYEEAEKRGFSEKDSKGNSWDRNFVSWTFKEDAPANSPAATTISYDFWRNRSDYSVSWRYDSENNQYFRFNGGKEHLDLETGEQISAKNVVVFFAKERGPVDRLFHILYTTTGKGSALIFQNGEVINATWEKKSRTDRTRFYDSRGSEISFVGGATWISIVPDGNRVSY